MNFAALIVVAAFVTVLLIVILDEHKKPNAPENCKHKRWTKWKIEQLKPIHLYSALDEGKDLPDRVDVYMTRQCVSCGTPQAKTVRGIDSSRFK